MSPGSTADGPFPHFDKNPPVNETAPTARAADARSVTVDTIEHHRIESAE
jgi:hypothetical protein